MAAVTRSTIGSVTAMCCTSCNRMCQSRKIAGKNYVVLLQREVTIEQRQGHVIAELKGYLKGYQADILVGSVVHGMLLSQIKYAYHVCVIHTGAFSNYACT